MYIFLSSTDCANTYPSNNVWDFTVDISQHVNLSGNWEVALMELQYTGARSELYIYSDICSSSYVNNGFLPLLRIGNKSMSFQHPYFLTIPHSNISHIRIYIRTKSGETPAFTPKVLRCTLQLRKAS